MEGSRGAEAQRVWHQLRLEGRGEGLRRLSSREVYWSLALEDKQG